MLKQLFLHMNQERCSPKKGKTKRRKKERESDWDKYLHGKFWRSKHAIFNAQQRYPYLQYIDVPGSAVMI